VQGAVPRRTLVGLVVVETTFGGGLYPSDGAQVWARLGGYYLIWFRETRMPRHVTHEALAGDILLRADRPTLCCHG
jgi:hypothetical protein